MKRTESIQLVLFWSWNLIFLAFMSLGFAPVMLPETLTAVRTGAISVTFLIYALVLAVIPVAAVILGLTVLRRSPSRLFALGYVVEGPLMLMLAVRFFAIRQATAATNALMLIAFLGMAAFLWYLLDPQAGRRRPGLEALRMVGLTLMVLTSLYAAAWIAFYAVPLGAEGGRALLNFLADLPRNLGNWFRSLWETIIERPLFLPFSVLGFLLLVYTATLFAITPIVVPYLTLRAWWETLLPQIRQVGARRMVLLLGGIVTVFAVVAFVVNRQPQAQAFALLEEPPTSQEQAQSLLERSETIRSGLLNAYLAPFRYISAEGEVVHVRQMYESTFKMSRQNAFAIQRMYERLASPLLYKPVHAPDPNGLLDNRALVQEPQEAARLYQNFFDTPITQAERPTIVRAARSTWSGEQAEAAWQAVDDREVHLVRQEITLQEQGDWASVELHEVYQNQTVEQQEVIYYFNLPESAVLTGVWLGNSPDKAVAFPFQVAPRGAAQAVFREQKRVNKDPALLEQIGPRQYRLRIFPIPRLLISWDEQQSRTLVEEAPEMHMWLAWRQMAQEGVWPMPQLAILRNVYWDESTERLVNGQPFEAGGEAGADGWLPARFPVENPVEAQAHRVDLPDGQTVLAVPTSQMELPGLQSGLRLAVVLDRSRSMEAHAGEVTAALLQIQSLEGLEAPPDVYLTASPYRGEEPSIVPLTELDPEGLVYFGGQNAAQLLAQFETLEQANRSDQPYDAVIVLTDGTGYELGATEELVTVPDFPVWIVHMGGEISLGYDDQTQEAIQASGGGVAGSLTEALSRLSVSLAAKQDSAVENPLVDLVDGYWWAVLPADQVEAFLPAGIQVLTHAPNDEFAALAARRLILAEMQRNRGTITEVETLDALHGLAMNYQIVTPFSSMIVLVNDVQQALLDRLSEQSDRFQREVEAVGETTVASPVPLAGVPEPHEWLLLGMAAALLVYLALRNRSMPIQFPRRFGL